jgi:hypothetical protein
MFQIPVSALARTRRRGILDHVIGGVTLAARFFYYGTGVPAAVGRA